MSNQPTTTQINSDIISAIITGLEARLTVQIQAAKDAHMAATHSESIAETKYDTFGLESSYLAQGQQKRVEEVTESLNYFKSAQAREDIAERQFIEPLTFITLSDEDELLHYFFLAEQAGGLKVTLADKIITVITPGSPIGKALTEKMVEDFIDLQFRGKITTFEVMAIQ